MGNNDHTIIGRAFEYYNNREERKWGQLNVRPEYTLTEWGLLGEWGVYHREIQRQKNNDYKNNAILTALFFVLKDALNPAYAETLKRPEIVYSAIEKKLGDLKWLIATKLTWTLNSDSTSIDEQKKSLNKPIEENRLVGSHTSKQKINGNSKDNQHLSPPSGEKKHTHPEKKEKVLIKKPQPVPTQTLPIHKELPTSKKEQKGKTWSLLESFINIKYQSLLVDIKQERIPRKKKELCELLFKDLCNDVTRYRFNDDRKIKFYISQANTLLQEHSITDELVYKLKFLSSRIDQLRGEIPQYKEDKQASDD